MVSRTMLADGQTDRTAENAKDADVVQGKYDDLKTPPCCPSCRTPLEGDPERCTFCGKVLHEAEIKKTDAPEFIQVPPPPEIISGERKSITCPSCFNFVSATAVMCYVCGTNLTAFKSKHLGAPVKEIIHSDPKQESLPDVDWQLTAEDVRSFEDKLKMLDAKLAETPDKAELWMRKGSILMELKRYEDAIEAYDKGIQYNPTSLKAWAAKAFAVNKLGNQKEAVKCYQKAMEICMAQSLDIDDLLQAVDRSKTYSEALDRALSVLMTMKPVKKEETEQPRCPKCLSFKVLPAENCYVCYKCKTKFTL